MKTNNVTQFFKSLARLALVSGPGLLGGALASHSFAAESEFKDFTQTIPGSTVKFDMIAIPTGEATVGSPATEAGRDKNDQPQKKVQVKRFWMGKCEVTWDEFLPYINFDPAQVAKFENKLEGVIDKDGITHPTKAYGSVYREKGEKGYFPALGMGWPSACNYCKWLSKKTGRHYRLPTEEEWEYAYRAGSTTAFYWGDDAAQTKDYAWDKDNSKELTHQVAKLKPNKFGLYDMAGNVGEWCAKSDAKARGVLRGGAFTEEVAKLRAAARMVETDEWNENDPQSPQSIWWLSAADFTGFRVVCDEEGAATAEAKPAAEGKPAPATSEAAAAVKKNYLQYCKGCHGELGKGDTAIGRKRGARDYTTKAVKDTCNEEAWFKAIRDGIEKDGTHIMSASKDKLSDDEMKALVQYMKNL